MTIAHAVVPGASAKPRWLLLGSLALNLFFIGVAVALMIRAAQPAPPIDRSAAARVERLAATLPKPDADKLRVQYAAQRDAVETAQRAYRSRQETMRQALRAEPFSADAMRAAMADTRAARQGFDLVLQGIIATAAAEMSADGRHKLAEWPPPPR